MLSHYYENVSTFLRNQGMKVSHYYENIFHYYFGLLLWDINKKFYYEKNLIIKKVYHYYVMFPCNNDLTSHGKLTYYEKVSHYMRKHLIIIRNVLVIKTLHLKIMSNKVIIMRKFLIIMTSIQCTLVWV